MILASAFQLMDQNKTQYYFFLIWDQNNKLKSENSNFAKKPRMFEGLRNKRATKGSIAIQWIKAKKRKLERTKSVIVL